MCIVNSKTKRWSSLGWKLYETLHPIKYPHILNAIILNYRCNFLIYGSYNKTCEEFITLYLSFSPSCLEWYGIINADSGDGQVGPLADLPCSFFYRWHICTELSKQLLRSKTFDKDEPLCDSFRRQLECHERISAQALWCVSPWACCLEFSGMAARLNLPPTLITPSWSTGFNL